MLIISISFNSDVYVFLINLRVIFKIGHRYTVGHKYTQNIDNLV